MHLDIDMRFSRTLAEADGTTGETYGGTIRAAGRHITITVDDEHLIPKASKSMREFVELFADGLAARGLSMSVESPSGELISLGDVRTNVIQRSLSRSEHVRIPSLRTLPRLVQRSGGHEENVALTPPPTPWPLMPTFDRRIRRRVTTTHYTPGSGRPRLVLVRTDHGPGPGSLKEFNLVDDITIIGSGTDCTLRLDGLNDVHAEIRHDGMDEYVLVSRGPVGGSSFGRQEDKVRLRTGSRLEMGPWRMIFLRAEYADHGRPFGGRQGGEFAYQRPQENPYRRPRGR